MRSRGEIEEFDLGEISGVVGLEGVVAGIAHVGPGLLKRWNIRARAFQVRELRRLRAERDGETPQSAPWLWPDPAPVLNDDGVPVLNAEGEVVTAIDSERFIVATEEGQLEFIEMETKNVAECIRYVKGRPGMEEETNATELAAEVERLGAVQALALKAMEVQKLSRPSFPAPEGTGHVQAEPASDAAE